MSICYALKCYEDNIYIKLSFTDKALWNYLLMLCDTAIVSWLLHLSTKGSLQTLHYTALQTANEQGLWCDDVTVAVICKFICPCDFTNPTIFKQAVFRTQLNKLFVYNDEHVLSYEANLISHVMTPKINMLGRRSRKGLRPDDRKTDKTRMSIIYKFERFENIPSSDAKVASFLLAW